MAKRVLEVRVKRSQGYYTAYIPELGITDYGKTKKELTKNLYSAISLALSDMVESDDINQRKFASQVVSKTIMEATIPQNDIKPLMNVVSNILVSEFCL